MALQKILDILRNARNERTVLTNTLPKREQKVRRVLMLEKEIDFVDKDIGLSPSRLVRVIRLRMLSSTTSIPIGIKALPRSWMS